MEKIFKLGAICILTMMIALVINNAINSKKYNSAEAIKARAEYNNENFHTVEDADGNTVLIPKE